MTALRLTFSITMIAFFAVAAWAEDCPDQEPRSVETLAVDGQIACGHPQPQPCPNDTTTTYDWVCDVPSSGNSCTQGTVLLMKVVSYSCSGSTCVKSVQDVHGPGPVKTACD